jgi:hypothetical protein
MTDSEKDFNALVHEISDYVSLTILDETTIAMFEFDRIIAALRAKDTPADLASVKERELTDAMCDAFLKATGEWIEPHEAETEDGQPVEMGITQEDADEFNAQAREQIRKGYAAAIAVGGVKE